MQTKNYIQVYKPLSRYAYFAFYDVKEYLANQIFFRYKIPVWFKWDGEREDTSYIVRFCRVRKCDVPAFKAAMEELKNSMLLCGHKDYEDNVVYLNEILTKEAG